MSRNTPSLVALLGLLAVAGYHNRDKIADLLNQAKNQTPNDPSASPDDMMFGAGKSHGQTAQAPDLSGIFDNLSDTLGKFIGGSAAAGGLGSILSGGLGDLMDNFQKSGRGDKTTSWASGASQDPIEDKDLEDVLGEDTLMALVKQTGLSRSELLTRLSAVLPDAVNRLSSGGKKPFDRDFI